MYPFEREKKSIIIMYAESDSNPLEYMNKGINIRRESASARTTVDAKENCR